ncbi:MAG: pyrroline-5-carboxylate reductase [Chthoniobacterales bacterium]|nr:MAG: pyrroline-5-carboxylate reductase [Chthoniobacterales bacterium]
MAHPLGFIGAGKLAGSVIRGLLLKKVCAPGEIIASEPHAEIRGRLGNELAIEFTAENSEVAEKAKTIFIGVKPQMVLAVLRELGDGLSGRLVVSFAAGVRIASMEAATQARVMRVMTNTPSAIGRAATGYAAGARATEADRRMIGEMFNAIGTAVEVSDEQIDAVTALAGSGPAFVYAMIEGLAAGAAEQGMEANAALKLAAQTALGAAELALTSGKSPEELIRMVVTPGGTTAAGLRIMQERRTREAMTAAIEAATARGREMARESATDAEASGGIH